MKKLLLIAVLFTVLGLAMVGCALAIGGKKAGTVYKEVTHTATEPFTKIAVTAGAPGVKVELSENGIVYAKCDESDKVTYDVRVENDTLIIEENDNRRWFDYIGITLAERCVTLGLPGGVYTAFSAEVSSGSVKIGSRDLTFGEMHLETSSGSIKCAAQVTDSLVAKTKSGIIDLENATPKTLSVFAKSGAVSLCSVAADEMNVETESGSIKFDECTAKTFNAHATSGSITLNGVIAEGKMTLGTSSGSVRLHGCDAGEMEIKTGSGSVRGELLTPKFFITKTGSGSVHCPDPDRNGEQCKITTGSGSISVTVAETE